MQCNTQFYSRFGEKAGRKSDWVGSLFTQLTRADETHIWVHFNLLVVKAEKVGVTQIVNKFCSTPYHRVMRTSPHNVGG